jgi:hypothetical protein
MEFEVVGLSVKCVLRGGMEVKLQGLVDLHFAARGSQTQGSCTTREINLDGF